MASARLGGAAKSSLAGPKAFLLATAIAAAFALERFLAARSVKVDFAGFAMVQERRYAWLILIQGAAAIVVSVLTYRMAFESRHSRVARVAALLATIVFAAIWLVPGLMDPAPLRSGEP